MEGHRSTSKKGSHGEARSGGPGSALKRLRGQLDELGDQRVRIDSEGQTTTHLDATVERSYAEEVMEQLAQSELTKARAFNRSFVTNKG